MCIRDSSETWYDVRGRRDIHDDMTFKVIRGQGQGEEMTQSPIGTIFACTAQRLVLDGRNGLSSSRLCAYCRIVQSELKLEVALATIIWHLRELMTHLTVKPEIKTIMNKQQII